MARALPDDDPELDAAWQAVEQALKAYRRRTHVRSLEAAQAALQAHFHVFTGTAPEGNGEAAPQPVPFKPAA